MEENEFRSTYGDVNQHRCVYEKAINNRHCVCQQADRILIAGRECVGCHDEHKLKLCSHFLEMVRSNAVFALKRVTINGPLPHNDELRVQAGGIRGLAIELGLLDPSFVEQDRTKPRIPVDISEVIGQAHNKDDLPLELIMQSVGSYHSRRKSKNRKK